MPDSPLTLRRPVIQPIAHHRFPASFDDVVVHAERHRVTSGSVWHHVHAAWELALVTCVRGETVVAGVAHAFDAVDCVLIPGGMPHRWVLGDADGPLPATFEILAFVPESIGGTLLARREYRPLRRLFEAAAGGLRFGADTARAIAPALHEATSTIGLRRVAHALVVFAQLAEAPDASPAIDAPFERSPYSHEIDTLERLVRTTLDRPQGSVRVADIAAAANMSESSLERMCKRITGSSFVTYLTARRVGRAAERLRATDEPIGTIARTVGFANLAHFNRAFRRHLGVTPREHRSSGRNG